MKNFTLVVLTKLGNLVVYGGKNDSHKSMLTQTDIPFFRDGDFVSPLHWTQANLGLQSPQFKTTAIIV